MSESNGAEGRTLGRKGRMRFRIAEDFPWVTLDVLAVNEQYNDLLDGFRDAEGKLLPKDREAVNRAIMTFVNDVLAVPQEVQQDENRCLTLTEALQFVKMVVEEVNVLRPFFSTGSDKPPSSPGSTELTLSDTDVTDSA